METNARLIDAEHLRSKLTETNLRVVDCRFDLMRPEAGRAMYVESHIPGAVHADLDRNLAGPVTSATGRHPLPDCHEFCRFLMDQGISNDSAVVVYDQQSGALAARLWWMLQWVGHADVSILDGGYSSWTAGGFATESGTASVVGGDFAG